MTGPQRLTPDDIVRHAEELSDWEWLDDRIRRTFQFASFAEAFGWMSEMALVAERMFHHPEWSNVYNRVTVELTTHDVDGLSDADVELARRMDAAAARRG